MFTRLHYCRYSVPVGCWRWNIGLQIWYIIPINGNVSHLLFLQNLSIHLFMWSLKFTKITYGLFAWKFIESPLPQIHLSWFFSLLENGLKTSETDFNRNLGFIAFMSMATRVLHRFLPILVIQYMIEWNLFFPPAFSTIVFEIVVLLSIIPFVSDDLAHLLHIKLEFF